MLQGVLGLFKQAAGDDDDSGNEAETSKRSEQGAYFVRLTCCVL